MRGQASFILLLAVVAAVTAGCASSSGGTKAAAAPAETSSPVTLPGDRPPVLHVEHPASGTAPGYVFLAQKGSASKPSGAVIADDRGRIVWYHQAPAGQQITDFRTQTLHGKPVLTWWQGTIGAKNGIGQGEDVIYDASYRPVATLHAVHAQADLHEFQLTPRGTAFVTAYVPVQRDLTSVGGPKRGWVYDSVVEELDVATGKAIFEWHSLDHVPLAESMLAGGPLPRKASARKAPLDYFHVNSVADGPAGTILISGRNTSAIYLLARDGHVVWRLGGKRSDFGPKKAVRFFFQHNARFGPDGTLSLFDNGGIPRLEPHSRPLVLELDLARKRASVVKTFVPPAKIASPYEGNLEPLADGGAFVGWGGVPKATEFAPDGSVRFQLRLPYGDSYRAYRLPWSGRPGGRPVAAVVDGAVHASWNGETGIARWQVLDGPKVVATAPWSGLETTIAVKSLPAHVTVRALDAGGRALGTSAPTG